MPLLITKAQAVRGIAPASGGRVVRTSSLSAPQFPTPLPRATPKDWAGFGTDGCPRFLTDNGRFPSNSLSSTKRPFSLQFLNIPQIAAYLRCLLFGYFIWQNGRFPPKPLAIFHHANQQTLLLQPNRCAILKISPLNLTQLHQVTDDDQNIGQG